MLCHLGAKGYKVRYGVVSSVGREGLIRSDIVLCHLWAAKG